MGSAEDAYVFRHALMRAAAYELQPVSERAGLHELAATLTEAAFSGAALDTVSGEIAGHLRLAREHADRPGMLEREREFTRRAAEHNERQYLHADALRCWRRLAEIDPSADTLRRT